MPVLYVTEQRSIIRKTSDRLVVEKEGEVLALDLLEEYRAALVDRFSARLLNLDIFQPESFTSDPERGVLLRKEALRRYFVEYEKELGAELTLDGERLTWRQLFRRQAERLARALLEDVPYEAFRLPC